MGDGKPSKVSVLGRWNPPHPGYPNGYDYPEYDYGIEQDGTIRIGRPLNVEGAHCVATKPPYSERGENWWNRHSIGIGLAGDFTMYPMPLAQFIALCVLVKRLMLEHGLTIDDIYPHGQVANTACPGCTYGKVLALQGTWSYDALETAVLTLTPEPSRGGAPPQQQVPVVAPPVALNFSYPNNARCMNDDLYIRDANGNRIPGRYVAKGDNITVLDVGYTSQLTLVEYPTQWGVSKGYVANVPSCIQYYHQGEWGNGSTPEPVLDDKGASIGTLNPRERATPLFRQGGKLHVVYDTPSGANTKSGYVAWGGGFTKF